MCFAIVWLDSQNAQQLLLGSVYLIRDNTKLERQIDRLQYERDRLDERLKRGEQSVNLQVQSNLAPDIRLDAILRQLKSLGSEAYDFTFLVNDHDVTNNALVFIPDDRQVRIAVKNVGEIVAKSMTIHFTPHTGATNIQANPDWQIRGDNTLFVGTNNMGKIPVYHTMADALIPPGTTFCPPTITILSNYASPVLRAQIATFAERTKEHICYINLVIVTNVVNYLQSIQQPTP